MNNKKKYIILGLAILAIVTVLYFVNWAVKKAPVEEANTEKSKGKEGERQVEKIPQKRINPSGTHLLYKLLEKYKNTSSIQRIQTSYFNPLDSELPIKSNNKFPNVYISVSESFSLESSDNDHLFDFVFEGNHAVIAFEELHVDFKEFFLPNSDISFYVEGDTTININFFHPKFKIDSGLVIKNSTLNYHRLPKYKNWLNQ